MATTGSNNGYVPQQQRKPGGPRLPTVPGRYTQQSVMQSSFQPQMLPTGSVLLPNPNQMMPATMYQLQAAGLMGPYIPNMAPQMIQAPNPYMQPAYRQSLPPSIVPQPPLQKRERKPIAIVDPNTKTVVQVNHPPPAATVAAATAMNPSGGQPVPGPYVVPAANVSKAEEELPSLNSVKEEFRMKVQDLAKPQTTPVAVAVTIEGKQLLADVANINPPQLGVNPGGLMVAPQPDLPLMVPVTHGDQVVPTGVCGVPLSYAPDLLIPPGGLDLTVQTLVATEPPGGPSMSVAEEFKAMVHGTLTSSQPIRVPTPTKDHPTSTNETEMKPPVLPLLGGLEVKPVSPVRSSDVRSFVPPVLIGDEGTVVPEEERKATPTVVPELSRDEETPRTGEEEVVAGKEVVKERAVTMEMDEEVVAGKEGVNEKAVTMEMDEEGGDEDYSRKEVKFPDDLSNESEKEEGEIDEDDEDLKKSSSPQQHPAENMEPALQGDPFVKPKSRHTVVANPGQKDGTKPRRYDREYLLQFRSKEECQVAPLELLGKDCFKKNDTQYQGHGGGGGGGGGRRGSRQGERNEPRKIIAHSASEKVELKKAEQPWQRVPAVQLELTEEQKETQEVFRKFQSILNKLTPQKFTKLADATRELKINTEERLKGVIDKIFTKSLEETNFSEVYANLCRVLAPLAVETVNTEGRLQTVTFRRLLLTKCQQEFEKDKQEDAERETMQKGVETAETEEIRKQRQKELEAHEVTSRHRSLGNIRFIGELYKLKILSESIMHECMIRLLKSASDEESLECFAKLMTTTGKDLDKEEAKLRIDTYFTRVSDIIKKGKISSRIKFALQDVVDLRDNKWVPRQQQDTKVKTIDQIHREAEDEEQMTKQLASQYMGGGMSSYGRRDSRPSSVEDKRGRGGQKPGEEWSKVGGEKRPQQASRPDLDRIRSMKKEKEPSQAGGLRAVSKWGVGSKGAGTSSAVVEVPKPADKQLTSKPPGRSSSGAGGGGGGGKKSEKPASVAAPKVSPGALPPRRSSTHPEEKASILQTVKEMTGGAIQKRSSEPPSEPPSSELDEETVAKKTENIIGELCENKDLKEAVECVKEMKSPGMLHVFVSETINYALENTTECRQLVGQLFHRLLQDGTLAVDRMVAGLGEVMESAEDIEIDVPKIWDYIGELLCPPVAHRSLPLGTLISTTFPSNLLSSGKAALFTTKLLKQCVVVTSEEVVSQLWSGCKEQQDCLQLTPEDLAQLEFLRGTEVATPDTHSALVESLYERLKSADVTNDDILDWIERNCTPEACRSPTFIRTLTTAMVQASVTGKGSDARYAEELFHRRLVILTKYVNSDKNLELEVLLTLQVAVAKLNHPPKLLYQMFNEVYDCEVVGEDTCYTWRDQAQGVGGKGAAIMSVKAFFDWLDSAEKESDPEGT